MFMLVIHVLFWILVLRVAAWVVIYLLSWALDEWS